MRTIMIKLIRIIKRIIRVNINDIFLKRELLTETDDINPS